MAKRIRVELSAQGIDRAIQEIVAYKQDMRRKAALLAEKLAERGLQVAKVTFSGARYDGENDVSVDVEERGGGQYAIVASGQAVLFIEFGAGASHPEHPQAAEFGMQHGTYGQGKGKQTSWGYYGAAGTDGKYVRDTDKGTVYRTTGNPPAMAMYFAAREIKDAVLTVAREVFEG